MRQRCYSPMLVAITSGRSKGSDNILCSCAAAVRRAFFLTHTEALAEQQYAR